MWLIKQYIKTFKRFCILSKVALIVAQLFRVQNKTKIKFLNFYFKSVKDVHEGNIKCKWYFTIFLHDNILGLFNLCILISIVSKVHKIFFYSLLWEANLDIRNDLLFKIFIDSLSESHS